MLDFQGFCFGVLKPFAYFIFSAPFFFIFFLFIFPPFIYFTSHLYCNTKFEDEDAICGIKYQVTRINGEGRI